MAASIHSYSRTWQSQLALLRCVARRQRSQASFLGIYRNLLPHHYLNVENRILNVLFLQLTVRIPCQRPRAAIFKTALASAQLANERSGFEACRDQETLDPGPLLSCQTLHHSDLALAKELICCMSC
jgi:hypothetical protein